MVLYACGLLLFCYGFDVRWFGLVDIVCCVGCFLLLALRSLLAAV